MHESPLKVLGRKASTAMKLSSCKREQYLQDTSERHKADTVLTVLLDREKNYCTEVHFHENSVTRIEVSLGLFMLL